MSKKVIILKKLRFLSVTRVGQKFWRESRGVCPLCPGKCRVFLGLRSSCRRAMDGGNCLLQTLLKGEGFVRNVQRSGCLDGGQGTVVCKLFSRVKSSSEVWCGWKNSKSFLAVLFCLREPEFGLFAAIKSCPWVCEGSHEGQEKTNSGKLTAVGKLFNDEGLFQGLAG